MSRAPDAWDDGWSKNADTGPATLPTATKKISSKASKAQKRAQQLEFNRQLWAEAEGPKETNYYLESRNVVPLTTEYKPPPILLSRKGPIVQRKPPTGDLSNLSLDGSSGHPTSRINNNQESSEDEEETKAKELTLAERQAQAARDRELKQRKYEERRQELFGTPSSSSSNTTPNNGHHNNSSSNIHQPFSGITNSATSRSGTSTPSSLTPPGSRSGTPNVGGRGRGRSGRGRGGGPAVAAATQSSSSSTNIAIGPSSSRTQSRGSQHRDLYDPSYAARPLGRENGGASHHVVRTPEIHPIRTPKGPDGSGRGGFGFTRALLGGSQHSDQPASSSMTTTTTTTT